MVHIIKRPLPTAVISLCTSLGFSLHLSLRSSATHALYHLYLFTILFTCTYSTQCTVASTPRIYLLNLLSSYANRSLGTNHRCARYIYCTRTLHSLLVETYLCHLFLSPARATHFVLHIRCSAPRIPRILFGTSQDRKYVHTFFSYEPRLLRCCGFNQCNGPVVSQYLFVHME